MKNFFLTFCFLIFICCFASAEESLIEIKQNLERINRDISDLQKELFNKKDIQQSTNNINQDESSQITVFDMRLEILRMN